MCSNGGLSISFLQEWCKVSAALFFFPFWEQLSLWIYDSSIDNLHEICWFFCSGFNLDTEEGDYLIPGFLNSIIGIQQGETKSFPLQFPETWKQENLRGVHAQFTVSSFFNLKKDPDDTASTWFPTSNFACIFLGLLHPYHMLSLYFMTYCFASYIIEYIRAIVSVSG